MDRTVSGYPIGNTFLLLTTLVFLPLHYWLFLFYLDINIIISTKSIHEILLLLIIFQNIQSIVAGGLSPKYFFRSIKNLFVKNHFTILSIFDKVAISSAVGPMRRS